MRYLIIDGMISGTGVRNSVEGGFLNLEDLGLPQELRDTIKLWLRDYEDAHYDQFRSTEVVQMLDQRGLQIRDAIAKIKPESKVSYFSGAKLQIIT